jgi:hypothetical protein
MGEIMAIIRTTGESIVRQHRRAARCLAEEPTTPATEIIRSRESFQPVLPARRSSSIVRRFIRAVNWDVAFNWLCWGLLIGCLIYFGIFVAGPFALKHLFNAESWLAIGEA